MGIDWSDLGTINSGKAEMMGFKYTGNFAKKTLGRVLHRIPVLGIVAASVLEIPALIKSVAKTEGNIFDKSKAFVRQLIKSAGYVGFTTAAISIAGAITFPMSAVAGLIGMGVGSVIGLMASKELNKFVDQV